MAKGARKITGFLWALLIAILSFFIIFIFFPDVSNRFFGVSIKGEDVQNVVNEMTDSVKDKASQAVDAVADKVVESVTEDLSKAAEQVVESSKDSVADILNKTQSN